jgi:pectin methylesterase-like acyl-CoA thioesterase
MADRSVRSTLRSSWSPLAGLGGVLVACSWLVACSAGDAPAEGFEGGSGGGNPAVGGGDDASSSAGHEGGSSSGGADGGSARADGGGGTSSGGADASQGGGAGADSGAGGGRADGGGGADAAGARDAATTRGPDAGAADAAGTGADSGARVDAGTPVGSGPLPGGLTAFPAPNVQGVCADPALRITFTGPPTLGASGKIQVFDASQPATPVAVVDMGGATFTDTVGGMTFNTLRSVYVDGNTAVVHLPSHPLTYGKTYYVTVDSGAIVGPTGTPVSITGTTTWRFSTASAAPAVSSSLSVAVDGSSPFCSAQGAFDAIPANNKAAVTVTIAVGTYHEIVHFTSKSNVTIQGADRAGTIISATNDNTLNPSTVGRSLVGIDSSPGLIIENLTIDNTGPQGTQEEALRLQSCDMCVVRNANIISLQDTLLWDGRIYADNCLIAGDVDFVWGGGAAYFNNCEIRDVTRSGWNVQARNPATTYGYVFVDSKLTADPGITGHGLARIDVSVFPASHVAYINCQMGSHIMPAGWTITGGTPTAALRFWEYQSVDPTGKLIDVSQRAAGSMQLNATQAAQMRDPTVVLAGWQPPTN